MGVLCPIGCCHPTAARRAKIRLGDTCTFIAANGVADAVTGILTLPEVLFGKMKNELSCWVDPVVVNAPTMLAVRPGSGISAVIT